MASVSWGILARVTADVAKSDTQAFQSFSVKRGLDQPPTSRPGQAVGTKPLLRRFHAYFLLCTDLKEELLAREVFSTLPEVRVLLGQ